MKNELSFPRTVEEARWQAMEWQEVQARRSVSYSEHRRPWNTLLRLQSTLVLKKNFAKN